MQAVCGEDGEVVVTDGVDSRKKNRELPQIFPFSQAARQSRAPASSFRLSQFAFSSAVRLRCANRTLPGRLTTGKCGKTGLLRREIRKQADVYES